MYVFDSRVPTSYSRELDRRVAEQEKPYGYEEKPMHMELESEERREHQHNSSKKHEK